MIDTDRERLLRHVALPHERDRALGYARDGSAWQRSPWEATQGAAWKVLSNSSATVPGTFSMRG